MKKWCMPAITIGELPTSYLQSLSYLEQIMCINKKLCEIIDYLNTFSLEEIEKIIDEEIANLKNYVDTQDDDLTSYINSQIQATKDYSDLNLDNALTEVYHTISQRILFLLNYIDTQNDILSLQLEEKLLELQKQIDNIIIKRY